MQVIRFQRQKEADNIIASQLCTACNPIIFQVFFSNFEDGLLIHDEVRYFAFDFADNGYGKHIAALYEDNDIWDALLQCSTDKVLLCA